MRLKFEEDMEKLPENAHDTDAQLIDARIVQYSALTKAFLDYDTKFRGKEGNFKLPHKGTYVLCYYVHVRSSTPFTTLRSYDHRKLETLQRDVGQVHRIWIESAVLPGAQTKLQEAVPPVTAMEVPG